MKRLLKSWVFWAFAVPGALLALVLFLHVESYSADCACDSKQEVWRLYVGFGTAIACVFSSESETPSAFHREILGDRHAHAWSTVNRSFTTVSGRGLISCGFTHANPLAWEYGQSPAFRAWLKAKVAAGEIDAAAIDREMARLTFNGKPEPPFGWTSP